MPIVLTFRVRRIYFDQIVMGRKRDEVRASKLFWDVRVRNIARRFSLPFPSGITFPFKTIQGLFLCGSSQIRYWLRGVEYHPSASSALGREPSESGKRDLGGGYVWKFLLGDLLAVVP